VGVISSTVIGVEIGGVVVDAFVDADVVVDALILLSM
jgi:hypothetical protein